MRPAAPGWRAMASTALAVARPCPRPHNPEAIAMPIPAAIAANGLSQFSPPVGSAARATPGTASTVINAKTSERRTDCPPSVMGCPLVMLGLLNGAGNVEHRKHDEDERLQECDEDLQRVQESDREHDHDQRRGGAKENAPQRARQRPAKHPIEPHEEEEDREQDVPAGHVAEESERQRERPGHVTDDLDGDHQP